MAISGFKRGFNDVFDTRGSPWFGSVPVKPMSRSTTPGSMGSSTCGVRPYCISHKLRLGEQAFRCSIATNVPGGCAQGRRRAVSAMLVWIMIGWTAPVNVFCVRAWAYDHLLGRLGDRGCLQLPAAVRICEEAPVAALGIQNSPKLALLW